MRFTPRKAFALSLLASAVASTPAFATSGYFTIGYGAKSVGMAGAGVAFAQDSLAASVNPAGMAHVGERLDIGARLFSPIREASLDTRPFGGVLVEDESRRNEFLIPAFGYTRKINDSTWVGISAYGNGGLNTTFDRNLYDEAFVQLASGGLAPAGTRSGAPDTGVLGVDLAQLILAPTISHKINDTHTVGASLLLGIQYFSARGLGNFQCFTLPGISDGGASCGGFTPAPRGTPAVASTTLTNQHNEWAYGAGVRVGWTGQVTPNVTLGAAAASKIYMSEFDDYSDLFAEDGDFDIPANFTLGIAVKATPKLTVAFDAQRIFYGDVKSINNAGPVAMDFLALPSRPLGTDDGFGFAWQDIWAYHLGINYEHNSKWTFRAGVEHNEDVFDDDELLFNVLAPAVVNTHVTFGFTYKPNKDSEWNFAYMHAFEEEVDGISGFGGAPVPVRLQMYQNSLDLSYSWKF